MIETERLLIRNFTAGDWREFQDVIINYQATDRAGYEPLWPTSFALKELTATEEAKISELVKKAVS